MTNAEWDAEIARYLASDIERRQKWVARLLSLLTVCARETYAVGGVGLDDPERMRRFNELMHRVSDQLCHQLNGTTGRPEEVFARIVGEEVPALGVNVVGLIKVF